MTKLCHWSSFFIFPVIFFHSVLSLSSPFPIDGEPLQLENVELNEVEKKKKKGSLRCHNITGVDGRVSTSRVQLFPHTNLSIL